MKRPVTERMHTWLWRLAVILGTGAWTWLPHWIANIRDGVVWWRIPVMAPAIFDTYAYLQWMGQAREGMDFGGHLGWVGTLIQLVSAVIPCMSVPECWLMTQWVAASATIFVSAWAFRVWASARIMPSRLFAVAMWFSFLAVLGMRPGIFSWYLPFGIAAMTAAFLSARAVEERRIPHALLWSVLALMISTVYAWFLVFIVIWIASVWAVWLIRKGRGTWTMMTVFVTGASLAVGWLAAYLIESGSGFRESLEMQERLGMVATHMPQVINLTVAVVFWIPLLFIVGRQVRDAAASRRIVVVTWAWFTLLLAWFVTPFMGYYIHNDHFRTPTVLLSWFTLAAVWSAVPSSSSLLQGEIRRCSVRCLVPFATFVVAIAFVIDVLRTPYWSGRDNLDVLHLSVWFTLAAASWSVLSVSARVPSMSRRALLIVAVLLGLVQLPAVYARTFGDMSVLRSRGPVFAWIVANVPPDETVCADPASADMFAAHSGRVTLPSETSYYLPETKEATLRRLMAYASGYDLVASASGDAMRQYVGLGQWIVCNQYPFQTKFLRALGWSDVRIDEAIGCPRGMLERRLATVMASPVGSDDIGFGRACPWVIVTDAERMSWHIPVDYEETRVGDGVSVWRVR
ncbi:hypothetical protein KJ781_03095 [Patescibacteria group bacterium]|nr:hypothetical protein [Patescibacteria group bacterium]MBU1448562.1 hypothetical protein [Patescibacteria group bacterium]MBU2613196.1 hypothetical protein [Patescibacteria group bacterium]